MTHLLKTIILLALIGVIIVVKSLCAQNVEISKLMSLKGHSEAVRALAFSPFGDILASGSDDRTVKLWRVPDGSLIRTLSGHTGRVISVTFSQDGHRLVTKGDDQIFIFWDVNSGQLVKSVKGPGEFNILSPDLNMCASKLKYDPSSEWRIQLLDLKSGEKLRNFRENWYWVRWLTFTLDGNTLVSGEGASHQGRIRSWNVASGKETLNFNKDTDGKNIEGVNYVLVSPDGTKVVSTDEDGKLKLREIVSGMSLWETKGIDRYNSISFSPAGEILVHGTDYRSLAILSSRSGRTILTLKDIHPFYVEASAFDPSGRILATGGGRLPTGRGDYSTLTLWRIIGVRPKWEEADSFHSERIKALSDVGRLLKKKDEFETEDEFQSRISSGEIEKTTIETKYSSQLDHLISEMKDQEIAESRRREQETGAKIRLSLVEAKLIIEGVGSYNADAESFPITINGVTQTIKIPRLEARSFKERYQSAQVRGMKQLKSDLKTWEYFNLVIIHPETGSQFPFGEQRDVGAMIATSTAGGESTPKSVVPPQLNVEASLIEPGGNRFLDAEEKGSISVKIANTGQGKAYGVIADLKCDVDDPKLTYSRTRVVGEIPAGETKSAEFEVLAATDVERNERAFTITVSEANKFSAAPTILRFETYPLQKPDLALVDFGITTASGDNIIIPGETVDISVRIQNKGQGDAIGPKFKVNLPPNTFFAPGSEQAFDFSKIAVGEHQDVQFSVLTNNAVGDQVTVNLGFTEAHTQGSIPLTLEINKPLQTIQQFAVHGREMHREIESAPMINVDVEMNIPLAAEANNDGIAVIIGNRDYNRNNPDVADVEFALRDASIMKEYLIKTLGYQPGNILYKEDAHLGDFNNFFGTDKNPGRMADLVKEGMSDLFIFYSGHGAPDPNEKKGYFIPVECDPNSVANSGYSLDMLYANLGKLQARSITVVIDACFSGSSGAGKMLIASASPVGLRITNPAMTWPNGALFTSSSGDEISSWYAEKSHGLFSYFFLKGLQGEADPDHNGSITAGELNDYIQNGSNSDGVPYMARRLYGRSQTPTFAGNHETVIRGKVK